MGRPLEAIKNTPFKKQYLTNESGDKMVTLNKALTQLNLDFSNPTEKAQHDKLVALVDTILKLHKKHHEARMEIDKGLYERQIKIADVQIDRLVYDLYGLTEEEIKVVEK